ncbi:MAG: DUF72 domain-containing protein [Candidatus Cyclobacteriaceae bacterium M3_2C_046]
MAYYIGTSGWSYDHWEGVMYPEGTKGKPRLDHYIRKFHTVELNSSFYHWPREAFFYSWYHRLPENFMLTVKAPRLLTHYQKLYAPERWVGRISRDITILRNKMGVLLVQLSPFFAYDYARLAYFLDQVPHWIRLTVEFRHPSWVQDEIFDLLSRKNAAYCVMSGAQLPCVLKATANFVYVRMHGPDDQYLYGGAYSSQDLQWWADRLREWDHQGKDVYVYFNNDYEGNAVRNALELKAILKA